MVTQVLSTSPNFEMAADFIEEKSVEVPILPPSPPSLPFRRGLAAPSGCIIYVSHSALCQLPSAPRPAFRLSLFFSSLVVYHSLAAAQAPFAFSIGFDKATSAWWDNHNRGKQWAECVFFLSLPFPSASLSSLLFMENVCTDRSVTCSIRDKYTQEE
jgi:hypothetical protein